MEAKASRTGGHVAGRRLGFRERLAGLFVHEDGTRNGASAAVSANHPSSKLDRRLRGTDAVALHGVELPDGSRIDSLIVGPAGVTVVNSSHYHRSKPAHVSPSGLKFGRRDRTDLIYEVLGRVAEVRELLADTPYAEVPVEAAIVLSEVDGVPVIESFNRPRILIWGTSWVAMQASRKGPLSSRKVDSLASFLGEITRHSS